MEDGEKYKVGEAPLRVFAKICEAWRFTQEEQKRILGNSVGKELLWKIGYTIKICAYLSGVFGGNLETEIAWLNTPHEKFGGASPREVMLRGEIEGVEDIYFFLFNSIKKSHTAVPRLSLGGFFLRQSVQLILKNILTFYRMLECQLKKNALAYIR